MAVQLAQDEGKLCRRHAFVFHEKAADRPPPRALEPQDPLDLGGREELQALGRLAGVLVAQAGAEQPVQVLRRDAPQLPRELAEARLGRALPDNGADQALPGDAARVVEKLGQSEPPARDGAVVEQRAPADVLGGFGAAFLRRGAPRAGAVRRCLGGPALRPRPGAGAGPAGACFFRR